MVPSRGMQPVAALTAGLILAAMFLAAGCSTRPAPKKAQVSQGIAFTRPDPDKLTGALGDWVRRNSRRRGTFVRHEGSRTYILVAWGEKPTGGYRVRIEDLARGRSAEVAVVELDVPAGPVTQAISYPYDLVSAPRLERPVVFTYRGRFTLTGILPDPGCCGRPGTRENQEGAVSENFRITTPKPGETIHSPVRIAGKARAFEATFDIEIEDGHNLLAKRTVTAGSAGHELGDFAVSVPFDPPTNPAGAILFVTYSAKDGTRREELRLPVSFRVP